MTTTTPSTSTRVDAVHRGARIFTLDPARPWASVMLVADGAVAAVGGEELLDGLSGDPVVVDHDGAFLMPGLGDVHNHHLLAGRADLFELQLDGAASLEELYAAIRAWSADLSSDAWVVGGGWGSTLIPEVSTLAALARLDEAAGGRPVMLRDDSCHNRWASSRALELAGITTTSTDPDDGTVVRDPATRRPVGLLIESALLPVEAAYAVGAGTTLEQDARSARRAVEILHSFGITTFQDAASSLPMLAALAHLDAAGDLPAWVVTSMQVNDKIFGTSPVGEELLAHRESHRSPHHRPDFVKIFLDGVPTSKTAAFMDPYLPDDEHAEGWRGEATMSQEELTGWLLNTAAQGLSAKIHCTGDRAVRMTLDAVEVVRAQGHDTSVYQIAHGEYIAADDVARMARLGVVADLSPALWFPSVIYQAICACIPVERARQLCPNKDLLDAGVLLAGGSDWPVVPSPNPWFGIQGLVTRADPFGQQEGQLWPEQALTVEQALYAYSLGAARAMGTADVTGSLEMGKSADFIVLDRDPFAVQATALAATTVTATYFAGRQVHPGA